MDANTNDGNGQGNKEAKEKDSIDRINEFGIGNQDQKQTRRKTG